MIMVGAEARDDRSGEEDQMNAQVIIGNAAFRIRGVDHLEIDGELVEIQRSSRDEYEAVAVAGKDLLVTIEPAILVEGQRRGPRDEEPAESAPQERSALGEESLRYPMDEPMD